VQSFLYLRGPFSQQSIVSLLYAAFQVERFRDAGIYPTADREWPCRVIDIAIAHWDD
jgi:hypothetical protein